MFSKVLITQALKRVEVLQKPNVERLKVVLTLLSFIGVHLSSCALILAESKNSSTLPW